MLSTTIKSLAAATALLVAGGISAHAESAFQTLAGVDAEPMNAVEMEETQGRFFLDPFSGNLWDFFGNAFVYDPANDVYIDPNGNPLVLIEGETIFHDILVDPTGQLAVTWFNMFHTAGLPDGTVVDAFGNVVGTWSGPGS